MLDTRSVEFPQVEDEEAESADEKHDDEERVSGAGHDVECKRE